MRRAAFIITALGLVVLSQAETWHVPADVPTIQAALDILMEGDTVLVDTGLYEEALIAPSVTFVLRGNVIPDSGGYPRPIVDPSSLPDPTHLSCFRQYGDSVVIENMWFRNRWPMHPSASDTGGGVYHPDGAITVRNCVFDSTFHSLAAYYADVTIEHCSFRHMAGYGPLTYERMEATESDFQSDTVSWAQLMGLDGSRIEGCHFSGSYGYQRTLLVAGEGVQVRNCLFGPGSAEGFERISFLCTNSVFENNLVVDWDMAGPFFLLDMSSPSSVVIRHNRLRNVYTSADHSPAANLYGFDLYNAQTCDTCHIYFEDNVIENCHGFLGAPGVLVGGGHHVGSHNRFTDISPWAAWNFGATWALHDNLFYDNEVALRNEGGVTDAQWNWWGDSTGPRCAQNPNGHGDSISGNIAFEPWYTDTTFFAEGATPHRAAAMPEQYSLEVYPNPFNLTARVEFDLPRAGPVELVVFNLTGQRVRELVNQCYEAGTHRVTFDAKELGSGIYFARIAAGNFVKTEKVVLLK